MVSLLSDEDIDRIAAFDITNTLNLYDPRFGQNGTNEFICPTCNKSNDACLGHHASLSLGFQMFHPLTYKHAEELLNTTCWKCLKPLSIVSQFKVHICPHCQVKNKCNYIISKNDLTCIQSKKQDIRYPIRTIPSNMLPKGYIMSKILIPPIHLRTPEDMEWSSEFQKLYDNFMQLMRAKKKNVRDISIAYTNIIGLNKQNGVIKILSGKDGIFRKIMMGKRLENSARAVIVGDPSLQLDQVAVPKIIAEQFKVLVCCTTANKKFLRDLATKNKLWWDKTDDNVKPINILPGMYFRRSLIDDDLVLLNRQPSLSRFSLMCFRVKQRIDDANTFGINPQVTAPFNADFDGDEMNIFMLSNSTEMYNLCHLSKCIRADNVKSTILVPVQDVVTGCYLMSLKDMSVSKQVWADCASYSDKNITNMKYTTRNILSLYIPNYNNEIITKKVLTNILYELNEKALQTLYVLQRVVEKWLETYGLSVPLQSLVTDRLEKLENESPDDFRERCYKKVEKDLSDTSVMHMINSGAKGSITHMSHMTIALGQQYIRGNQGVFCHGSYLSGLPPDEFFGHQMAAREGVVSTGTSTAITGYLNRKACKIMADTKTQYNNTVADNYGVVEFL